MIGMDIILPLVGGLGLFLYGMKLMSDSLEKSAGAKLRGILELFTKNKYIGILVGVVVTAIIQSSSASTVMVVSFVNAGLMNLYQAVGVIFGANIGTTVTSQLVSLDLSEIAPVFAFAGVVMIMFIKNPMIKKIGEVVMGFGILFLGLSMMSASMADLRDAPLIRDLLQSLTSPFLAILLGFVITAILQSSSVTVSIVLIMAVQGLLTLQISFFITLGCNMGSCVSALLASISGKKNAKRAAMIHFLFNLIGSAIITVILIIGMPVIENFILNISGHDMGRSVANAHTIFKLFQVVILLPFSNLLVKLTYLIIPGEDEKANRAELKYIQDTNVLSPTTAVPQAMREINRMGIIAKENLNTAIDALLTGDSEKAEKVYEVEKSIDYLNHEITQYLIKANQLSLPVQDRKLLAGLFHVVSDIERVGDHAENIAEDALVKKELKLSFTDGGDKELRDMLEMVNRILTLSLEMFDLHSNDHLDDILVLENDIDQKERDLQNSYIERLNRDECSAQSGIMFSDLVSNLERIADHATNIAFSMLDKDPEKDFEPAPEVQIQ